MHCPQKVEHCLEAVHFYARLLHINPHLHGFLGRVFINTMRLHRFLPILLPILSKHSYVRLQVDLDCLTSLGMLLLFAKGIFLRIWLRQYFALTFTIKVWSLGVSYILLNSANRNRADTNIKAVLPCAELSLSLRPKRI